MKRISPLLGLFAVISLWFCAISPASAVAAAPVFEYLGKLRDGTNIPVALDVDVAGNLYVADARGGKIHFFNPYGDLERSVYVQGTGRGIAVTPEGTKLYVSQMSEVAIVDVATGNIIGALDGDDQPEGGEFGMAGEIDLDAAGNVFVTDVKNGKMLIKIYDANGNYLNQFGSTGTAAGQFMRITGMTINPQGQVVVVDDDALYGKVQTFTMDANLTAVPAYTSVQTTLRTSTAVFGSPELYKPRGFTYDSQGRGYFTEFFQSNLRITSPTFTYLTKFTDPSGNLAVPVDAVFDAATSRLFVSCGSMGVKIYGIDGGQTPANINTPPSVPVTVSPVGNVEVNSSTPVLVVGNSVDAQNDPLTYHVVVKQGEAVVYEAQAVPAMAGEVTQVQVDVELAEDMAFTWTVQASDGQEVSEISAPAQFVVNANQPPAMPSPQSPLGGSEVATASPTLMFGNATDPNGDALTYLVAVQRDGAEVHQVEVAEVQGEVTSVTLSEVTLEENATYSWTVQAYDGLEHSGVSVPVMFVVNAMDEAPSAPELAVPGEGAILDGYAELSWSTSVDPDPNDLDITYQVEVALDSGFGDVVLSGSQVATTLTLGEFENYLELEDGATYFWRVTAFDDDQTASDPSLVQSFVYDTTMLNISANLPDAEVFLSGNHGFEGRPVGVAPVVMRDVATGFVSVVIKRPGFEPYVTQLLVGERENVSHKADLVPAMQPVELSYKKNTINNKQGLAVSSSAVPFMVDFNNDGQVDLLVADGDGQLHLYTEFVSVKNNAVTIGGEVPLANPVLPGASVPFVADWNNDGRKDLLVGLFDGSVWLYTNVGLEEAPAFDAGQQLQAGSAVLNVGAAAAPAVIDYNKDGRKDLLVGNGIGEIVLFVNGGSDDAPQLSTPVPLFSVSGAAVPYAVDWDEDGRKEIMVTASGTTAIYVKQPEGFVQGEVLCSVDAALVPRVEQVIPGGPLAVVPIDINGGGGKELIVGASDGTVVLMNGQSDVPVPSYQRALLDKLDDLAELVADGSPELLADVMAIYTLVEATDYALAKQETDLLITQLPEGEARLVAQELSDLYVNTEVVVSSETDGTTATSETSGNGKTKVK